MKIINTPIEGCFEICPKKVIRKNMKFVNSYNVDDLRRNNIHLNFKEQYYTISKKNVLRGMHFQNQPKSTEKLVSCLKGNIFDVVIDLRKSSRSYLKTHEIELSEEKGNLIYIPKGLAHGFYTLSEEAIVLYKSSEIFYTDADNGILWDSLRIEWPHKSPIVSEKDKNWIHLDEFVSPF